MVSKAGLDAIAKDNGGDIVVMRMSDGTVWFGKDQPNSNEFPLQFQWYRSDDPDKFDFEAWNIDNEQREPAKDV